MKVQILHLLEGAKKAEGLTVIIDVFRAFSLEAYIFAKGAKMIYPIGDLEEAFSLKRQHPDWILFGERGGAQVEGCDYGNSPSQIEDVDLSGRTIIHTTSAGTQGLVNAVGASEIITGSLVNAQAIAEYILKKNPEVVSIVPMGKSGLRPTMEDELCADYLKLLLEGRDFDIQKAADELRHNGGEQFFDADNQEVFPERDFYLTTDCNIFHFVIRSEKNQNGKLVNTKVEF
ncbi:MAG: 2-phosphosulfolactate phosphatase [Lachnospiraceae bacterium]|nr:2-phosphosulfolactate phosphatase [Lachnospiraceae bacterium]